MSVIAPVRTVTPRNGAVPALRRFSRTTPGVVVVLALVVAVCCVVAGVLCAAELNRRIAEHNTVLQHSEPFAYAAQDLYAALSEADAASASAFLSGGIQTPAMRERYRQAIAAAASALTDVTAGADDEDVRAMAGAITTQLATYTGLVETARANNLQGFPVGSAYLREASALMQTTILPQAEQILLNGLAVVEASQRSIGALPTSRLVLLFLLLSGIAVGSWRLARRTNRQFNLGLITASALVLLAMTWIVVATQMAAADLEHSRVEGTARFEELSSARILAQGARTDETLALIARGDITAGEKAFSTNVDQLLTKVDGRPPEVVDGVRRWTAGHQKHVQAYLGGDYLAAVAQAIGTGQDGSARHFGVVEASLRDAIEHTRSVLRERVSDAGAALAWSPAGTLVLLSLAATAAVAGLWPRLKEFL